MFLHHADCVCTDCHIGRGGVEFFGSDFSYEFIPARSPDRVSFITARKGKFFYILEYFK